MNICELSLGERASIEYICGESSLVKRLQSLGFIEGTEIYIKSTAPFGDPIILNIRGFDLAIRKQNAKDIFVKKI